MYETVDESVDVLAAFGRGFRDAKPLRVEWNNRTHIIDKIGYQHKVREGRKVHHIYSCSTEDGMFFELRFDADDINWTLKRTWDGETT